jgi:glycosyltransferase involved in cell wall biosynthesis
MPNFIAPFQPSRNGPTGDIISIGTLEPRKNHAFLLRVLKEAKKRGKLYSLTIVGGGESEVLLKTLAADLGVASQVTFTGYLLGASGLLQRHRLYAHSAKIESFGLVLVEALSAGLPVIAPPVGGIPEIITDGVEGYLWDTSNVEASAQLLINILDNDYLQRSMSAAARRRFESQFPFEQNARTLWNLLSNCVQKTDPPCE